MTAFAGALVLSDGEQPLPNWRQALILLVAGTVILASSCFGVERPYAHPEFVKDVSIVGMLIGTIGVVSGVVLVLFVAVVSVFRALRRVMRKGTR